MAYIVDFFALCSVQLSHRGSQVEEMLVAHVVVASHKMYTSSIVTIVNYSSGLHLQSCYVYVCMYLNICLQVKNSLCVAKNWSLARRKETGIAQKYM